MFCINWISFIAFILLEASVPTVSVVHLILSVFQGCWTLKVLLRCLAPSSDQKGGFCLKGQNPAQRVMIIGSNVQQML